MVSVGVVISDPQTAYTVLVCPPSIILLETCKSKSGYGCDYGFGSIEKPVEKHKSTAPSAKTFTVISKDATIAD